ncbi:MAG: hypothetical protein ABIN97_11585 [Ginsengibacter sp.]
MPGLTEEYKTTILKVVDSFLKDAQTSHTHKKLLMVLLILFGYSFTGCWYALPLARPAYATTATPAMASNSWCKLKLKL